MEMGVIRSGDEGFVLISLAGGFVVVLAGGKGISTLVTLFWSTESRRRRETYANQPENFNGEWSMVNFLRNFYVLS